MSSNRDDANMAHFKSRSQQPKRVAPPHLSGPQYHVKEAWVHVIQDAPMGSVSDQIDDVRFRYTGTSPGLSRYDMPRQLTHACMGSAFDR